jgi:hypothetical protein
MSKVDCQWCDKNMAKSNLKKHQQTKACLKKQEEKKKLSLLLEVPPVSPQVQEPEGLPVESDNSTQYKDISGYEGFVFERLRQEFELQRQKERQEFEVQIERQRQNFEVHIQSLQLQIELLRQPIPTCETVNSECQTDSDVAFSECDTVSVKSEEEIVPQIKKAKYVRKVTPITVEQYSEKSFVVRGDTFDHKTKLSELGGKWNKSLTDKTTQAKFGAWVFSNSKRDEVDKFLKPK